MYLNQINWGIEFPFVVCEKCGSKNNLMIKDSFVLVRQFTGDFHSPTYHLHSRCCHCDAGVNIEIEEYEYDQLVDLL